MKNFFTISELLHSSTAVEHRLWNGATQEAEENLDALRARLLNPLRSAWGRPLTVASGFRCAQLNALVHGAPQSQHMRGEAADICAGSPADNLALARLALSLPEGFDQLILEETGARDLLPQWLHLSWKRSGGNRRQVLRKVKSTAGYQPLSREEVLR